MPVQSDAEVFALPVQPASRPANLTLRRMVRFYSFSSNPNRDGISALLIFL